MKRLSWAFFLLALFTATAVGAVPPEFDLLLAAPGVVARGAPKNLGVRFTPGVSSTQGTLNVTPVGGEISFTDGPLAGVTITIPPNAVKAATTFTVSSNSGTLKPVSGQFSGRVIDLQSSGQTVFSEPIKITVPCPNNAGVVPVPFFIGTDRTIQACDVGTIDTEAGVLTYYTSHASLYTEIWTAITGEGGQSAFRASSDGFQIDNAGSQYNPSGECFGMSGFSAWHFRNYGKGFYPKFMQDIVSPVSGLSVKGQDIIATRAHISYSQKWNVFFPMLASIQKLSDEQTYNTIISLLRNTKNPVMLYLSQKPGSTGTHAVLAYNNSAYGTIAVYDPNNPGTPSTITYDVSTKSFIPYAGYTRIRMIGQGSIFTEPYEKIYADALAGFHGSADAQIAITSHTADQQVTERTIQLKGTVQSGEMLVNKLEITLNGKTTFSGPVDADGNFTIPLSLVYGKNDLSFTTYGTDAHSNSVMCLNNLFEGFTLNLLTGKAAILVTLTWGGGDTDLDLYMVDPGGDYSCYYHKTTADGGVLDYDIQHGYGPEHWTLLDTSTVRWDQPYKVRVHYYSDHSSAAETVPVSFTVNVLLYEGTEFATTLSYAGALTSENYSNTGPTSTGADWADVATITPVQPGAGADTSLTVSRGVSGALEIKVPVPLPEQRIK